MSMTPPPFSPGESPSYAPRKSNSSLKVILLILFLVCVPCIGLITVGGYFGFKAFGGAMKLGACALGFDDVRKAILRYADDHDGKLPDAKTWQTDVEPYYSKVIARHKDTGPVKLMPVAGPWGCDDGNGRLTGIAFNEEVSGKRLADIKSKYSVILIYEIDAPGTNAHGIYKYRPKSTSPIMFGQHRGWIAMPIEGEMTGFGGANWDEMDKANDGSGSTQEKNGAKGSSATESKPAPNSGE